MKPIITAPRVEVATLDRSPLRFEMPSEAAMPHIAGLLRTSPSRTCDYSIGGIYMWADYFKYQYCIFGDTLFVLGRTENRPAEHAFMLPTGALPAAEAVRLVRGYCDNEGLRTVFSAVPADRLDELLAAAGTGAEVEPLSDWADYLYDIGTLASCSGKRMMHRRNHINRFVADNPGWSYQPLGAVDRAEALAFMDRDLEGEKTDIDTAAMSLYEHDQSRRVVERLEVYPSFEGAVLRDGSGRIVALTVGETVGDVLYCHIEKMCHDVPGAGAMICKLYCADMLTRHPSLRYVNREEDCGDPGLRKAKLDLHPIELLHKYNVRL